jgi:hypothetical protein
VFCFNSKAFSAWDLVSLSKKLIRLPISKLEGLDSSNLAKVSGLASL